MNDINMSLSSTLISTIFCLLATSLLMVAAAPSPEPETEPESKEEEKKSCNQLHAAFYFRRTYFFIYGDNSYMSGFNMTGDTVYSGRASAISFDKQVTAAVGFPYYDMFILLSGKHEQAFHDFSRPSIVAAKKWSNAERELEKYSDYKGVDAASMTAVSNMIYFAGCHYVEIDPHSFYLAGKGTMEELGLPCNVDAALHAPNPEYVMVLKGHQVYLWSAYTRRVTLTTTISEELPFLQYLNLCPK